MRTPSEGATENVIEVVVMPLGSPKQEITLPAGATVAEALKATGYEGSTARVSGVVAEAGSVLDSGDRIVVTGVSGSKIEGGK